MMKQFQFTEDYEGHKKGEVIGMGNNNFYHTFIHPLLMRGILKVIRDDKEIRQEVKEEIEDIKYDENLSITEKLMQKKMQDLQEFGRKYDARDTKKSELVDEILEKAPIKDIEKWIGG